MIIKSDDTLSEGTRELVDETHQSLMSKPRHTTSTVCKLLSKREYQFY